MNNITRRLLLGSAAAAAVTLPGRRPRAQEKGKIRLGVLNDQSGPYRDTGGLTSFECTKQAVAEFAAQGFDVDVITADHQNKPDIGAGIARQWFDREGVDAILDVPTSSVALAVAGVAKEKDKVLLNTGAATADLTGKQCGPNIVHWSYDTYMLGKSTGGATVRSGGDSWYFLTADYVFGHQLQESTTRFVTDAGGKVLGASVYPFPGTTDFSSFLLQAQASGAKVLGLCNAGADTVNSIKQAKEFGVPMRVAAMLMFISDVHALGLDIAQGLTLTESFYWDLNDRTRAFTNRVKPRTPNNWPNMTQAGCYAAALHYLKAVQQIGVDKAKASGAAAVAAMKAMPTDDDAFGHGSIREDGRGMFPSYLFQVKTRARARDHGISTSRFHRSRRSRRGGRCPKATAPSSRRERRRMVMIFGKPLLLLYGQLTLGLINGAFYALLSLGLAVIFGLLNVINFAHGALFMLGAFVTWGLLTYLGIGYWAALVIAPIVVGALGVALEKLLIARLHGLDHLYGLLLTFGCALVIEGLMRNQFGSSGVPYAIPHALQGPLNLGFMVLPLYRAWVVIAAAAMCLVTWLLIEKTRLGATLRAATENAPLVQAFGVNVPRLVTLTYGAGVGLAAFAGVLAAPMNSVNPNMGSNLIVVVFATVVIGGLGSILGSIITGFSLGIIEGLTKVYYPEGSATVVFVVMVIVLLIRPAGLFGKAA